MAIARITSKGQVTIPKEVRERLGVQAGDALDFHFEEGRLEVSPLPRRRLAEFRGIFRVGQAQSFTQERTQSRTARASRLAPGAESDDA